MTGIQPTKGFKRDFFPLFPTRDPPTALRSMFENSLSSWRYVQGAICCHCTVMEPTCVSKSDTK